MIKRFEINNIFVGKLIERETESDRISARLNNDMKSHNIKTGDLISIDERKRSDEYYELVIYYNDLQ